MALPAPPEIVHEILRYLVSSSKDCVSCLQNDLAAVAAASRTLNVLATPYLYRNINLAVAHDATTYERRLKALLKSLEISNRGELVETLQLRHEETATGELCPELVRYTPGLRELKGVEDLCADDMIFGLPQLATVVLHEEEFDTKISTLLDSFPKLRTLVLGEINSDSSSFSDLLSLQSRTSLEKLWFHDLDLENHVTPISRDGILSILPPLNELVVDYSLGFSLSGILHYLEQSPAHAERLQVLTFTRQLRRGNSTEVLADVLAAAPSLRTLRLGMVRYPGDPVEAFPANLVSGSLQEIDWSLKYASPEAVPAGGDEFVNVLVNSLATLPTLKRVTVGVENSKWLGEMNIAPLAAIKEECEKSTSPLTIDPAMLGKDGKRILLVLRDGPDVDIGELALQMKYGVGSVGPVVCSKDEDEEASVCEDWSKESDANAKEMTALDG